MIAWIARRLKSAPARRGISLGFFTYFLIGAILGLVDALSHGWMVFSGFTLGLLVVFALGLVFSS